MKCNNCEDKFSCNVYTMFVSKEESVVDKMAELNCQVEKLKEQVEKANETETRLSEAYDLLSQAHDLLDDVHCYDTDLYREIGKFLEG